jgi:hypothetical protein
LDGETEVPGPAATAAETPEGEAAPESETDNSSAPAETASGDEEPADQSAPAKTSDE